MNRTKSWIIERKYLPSATTGCLMILGVFFVIFAVLALNHSFSGRFACTIWQACKHTHTQCVYTALHCHRTTEHQFRCEMKVWSHDLLRGKMLDDLHQWKGGGLVTKASLGRKKKAATTELSTGVTVPAALLLNKACSSVKKTKHFYTPSVLAEDLI